MLDTFVHTINLRNQTMFDLDAARDILKREVNKKGITIQHQNKCYITKGSQRLYYYIQTQQDLPL